MITQLHPKNTPSLSNRRKKTNPQMSTKQMLQQLSRDLMKPRAEAVNAIMAALKLG